jgi:sphingosine kinase
MKKILIIINPNSGKGKSCEIFEKNVVPFLSNIFYYNKITYTSEECDEMLKVIDKFTGVIVLGGDGSISKIVQYFLQNNIDIPIGHIPCGSGNGLSKSLLFEKNMEFNLENTIEQVLKFNSKKIDTMQVDLLDDNKRVHSFLFLSVGVFSNLDLNTEWLRFLGEFRFTIGAIWEILWKNTFFAKLKYTDPETNEIIRISGEFLYFTAGNLSHTSAHTHSSPYAESNDGTIKIAYKLMPCSRFDLYEILNGLEDGSLIQHLEYIETKEFILEPSGGNLDIDGEYYESQKIHVKNIHENLNIYC